MTADNDRFEAARSADSHDVELLVSIARSHGEAIAGARGADLLLRRELVFTTEQLRQAFVDALASPDHCLVAGTYDDVVFGYGLVRYESLADGARLARLEQFVVDAEARQVGIGEAMMRYLLDEAIGRGCIGIDSIALPGDRATKNFFESFGLKARQLVVHRSLRPPDGAVDPPPDRG